MKLKKYIYISAFGRYSGARGNDTDTYISIRE